MRKYRSSVLLAILMLVLCGSIIVGSTLAYFTSEDVSGENIIAASTLEAGLDWAYQLPADESGWQDAANGVLFNETSWEPNHTAVRYIRVKNGGSLAFSYELNVLPTMVVEGGAELMDVIDVYFGVVDAQTPAITRSNFDTVLTRIGTMTDLIHNEHGAGHGILLPEGVSADKLPAGVAGESGTATACIVLHMQKEAGNEYMGLSAGDGFKLQLAATQYNYEPDAFGMLQNPTLPDVDGYGTEVVQPVGSAQGGLLTADVHFTSSTGVTATVPAGAKLETGVTELKLIVIPKAQSDANVQLNENEALDAWEVRVEGLAKDNTVPVRIALGEVMQKGLNIGNYSLYHVEDGATNQMTRVDAVDANAPHNSFSYNPATGDVEVAMATFSEVAVVADDTAKWKGVYDYNWYDAAATDLIIANADQLAAFSAIVGGMDGQTQDSFDGKTIKLISDINLGDKESENNENLIFYPIGYTNSTRSYQKVNGGTVTSTLNSFEGTFDGNGHTISNFYQNTWEMFGDYNDGYPAGSNHYKDGMGLFGYVVNGTVKNLTVNHFSSDGEFTPTGVIAAYAVNSTFENIAITNCNPRVYNTGNGGIVGIGGNSDDADDKKLTFTNITVDNTNIISALWGSWDVACGGLMGMFRGNGLVDFTNCHVAAQIDVYNDVCGNYQYYWYRYSGMMIGSIRKNTTEGGYMVPDPTGITFDECSATYGPWSDYVYCEFAENSQASYTEDYQFSRVNEGEYIINGAEIKCTHDHKDVEDKRAVLLPFNQLFNGHGYGVKAVSEYAGVKIYHKNEVGVNRASVEKFEYVGSEALEADKEYKVEELFRHISGQPNVSSTGVVVSITDLDDTDGIATTDYVVNNEMGWAENTITFTGTGKVKLIIQDYYFCTPTTVNVTIGARKAAEKFETKFIGDFLYRVGNQNAVKLDSLFKAIEGTEIGEVFVAVEAVEGTKASGTYTSNATWTNGTLQFSGTGVVKVTIKDNDTYCVPTELELEIVDAINATTATSAKNNNVVLLNNCNFNTVEVSGGYALFGNGFTMTATSDVRYHSMGVGFVTLNNGTLDNVQIVCPNYSYSVVYNSNITETGNNHSYDSKSESYGNVRSAVIVDGNSNIVNSYIHGGRAAVFLRSGNLLIDGSTISGGAAANIHAISAKSLTLRDVTLVQRPFEATVHDTTKRLMGFSGLFECDENGYSTPLILEGKLIQDAWVDESYTEYVPSNAVQIVKKALAQKDYIHDLDGNGEKESLNLGFTYIPQNSGGSTNVTVEDNRTNKSDIPYSDTDVSYTLASAKVFSYNNSNGTDASCVNVAPFIPFAQGNIAPSLNFTDVNADRIFETAFDSSENRWESTLTVNLDNGDYNFSFINLLAEKYGKALSYTVEKEDGTPVDASKSIALTTSGVTTYILTAMEGDVSYKAYFILTATKSSIPEPEVVDTAGGTPLLVVKSKNSDWSCAIPALEGIKIKYWISANNSVTLDLATLTPTSTGKQNGTNNFWEYSNGYRLKVTCGYIHDTKKIYGMPVVVNNSGNKMYFTISSTNGYVSTSTAARTVALTYEFTDPNGKTITFTKTWQFNYADYKNGKQYSYSDFVNGTLKEASSGGGCVTPETLVTLADGSKNEIQYVTYEDELLVWDFFNGEYAVVPSAIIFNHGEGMQTIIKLTFDDETVVKVVSSHRFLDAGSNDFVYIDDTNAADYIGHSFVKQDGNSYKLVQLADAEVYQEMNGSYSIISAGHYNFTVEDMWSTTFMPEDVGAFTYFGIGEDMKYSNVESDIETYGLYSYEDFAEYLTQEQFEAFNVKYMKIAVEKGNITYEDILRMIDSYLN